MAKNKKYGLLALLMVVLIIVGQAILVQFIFTGQSIDTRPFEKPFFVSYAASIFFTLNFPIKFAQRCLKKR